ncbi:MAG: hypothetical protein ACRCUY_10890 [Thermoguttaceae bacterium]
MSRRSGTNPVGFRRGENSGAHAPARKAPARKALSFLSIFWMS